MDAIVVFIALYVVGMAIVITGFCRAAAKENDE